MQLIEAAQQPILRIDARTKFALLFGVGISSLMFPPLWLEATTFVLMALLLTLNRRIKTSAKFTAASLTALHDCKAVFSLHRVCTRQPLF